MNTLHRFEDRKDAGLKLAEALGAYADQDDVLVLGLARGGMPVAYQVARVLQVPLDVMIVQKLGVPRQEELAMGAIALGGVRVLNEGLIGSLRIDDATINAVEERERRLLRERAMTYRGTLEFPDTVGKRVIIVDDGLATGASMRAAIKAVAQHQSRRIIVAVPTGAGHTVDDLAREQQVDEVICLMTRSDFRSVGTWYDTFDQVSDDVVKSLTNDGKGHRIE